MPQNEQPPFFSSQSAIDPIKATGFRSTDTAIAELVDNSIQNCLEIKKQKCRVDIICYEEPVETKTRMVSRISKIAVLDNAAGMNSEILSKALAYGQGEHLAEENQNGMGKYGVGLPNASISQCKRTDVYTWQKKGEILYSYIDTNLIREGSLERVPKPEISELPSPFNKIISDKLINESGTLIVWSDLENPTWVTSEAILKNVEHLVGRMYRKFIDENIAEIYFSSYGSSGGNSFPTIVDPVKLRPNDPMGLMTGTISPSPWDNEPPFIKWADPDIIPIQVGDKKGFTEKTSYLTISYSMAKKESREWGSESGRGGSTVLGKLCDKNKGVSVIRSNRELSINKTFISGYDPRERWIGVEVSFNPDLDVFMGVDNKKQDANEFFFRDINEAASDANLKPKEFRELLEDQSFNYSNYRNKMHFEISTIIKKRFNTMLQSIQQYRKGVLSGTGSNDAETSATDGTKKRKIKGKSDDKFINVSDEQKIKDIVERLIANGLSEDEAKIQAKAIVEKKLRYRFVSEPIGMNQIIFDIKEENGIYFIIINMNHPAHDELWALLESENKKEAEDSPSLKGLKLILAAWARLEDEATGDELTNLQDIRLSWGKIARDFLHIGKENK